MPNGEPLGSDGVEGPPAVLQSALEHLRLEGALFFRSELTEAFEFESSPLALADTLHPGAERLILFHIVARGSCWVTVADSDRYWAHAGDVIVLPYGDRYVMGGEGRAECASILELLDAPPWEVMPLLRHGGGGARTDIVCGYLYSDDPLFDPAMRALPTVFVVRLPQGPAAGWVQASIAVLAGGGRPSVGPEQELDRHEVARAGVDRSTAGAPGDGSGGRPWMDRRPA